LSRGVAVQLSEPQAGGGAALCLELGAAVLLLCAAAAVQTAALRRTCRAEYRQARHGFQALLDGETTAFFEKTSRCRLDAAARACAILPAARARTAACWLQLAGGAACLAAA